MDELHLITRKFKCFDLQNVLIGIVKEENMECMGHIGKNFPTMPQMFVFLLVIKGILGI